jgi:hypothetical protein
MGYKPVKKVYSLEFVDHPGLEVVTRGATLGEIKAVQKMNINVNEKDEEKKLEVFHFFASKLISWNMEHPEVETDQPTCALCGLQEDAPLPTTVNGMLCLELHLIITIIKGWVFAVARVADPKEMSLNDGESNGLESPPQNGITPETMQRLETLQNPMISPEPNFT